MCAWNWMLSLACFSATMWVGGAASDAVTVSVRDMVGIAGVPVIVALVELVKLVFPGLEPRYYPLVAIGWGLLVNLGLMGYSGAAPIEAAAVGILAALAASGLYSQAKVAIG